MGDLLHPVRPDDSRFGRCGTHLRAQDDPARFGSGDAELHFDGADQPRFYVMRVKRRPAVVAAMTCHHRVSQCLCSADAQPFWMVVAPPGASIPEPELMLVKLLPGEGVKLHPGTWHAGPFFTNATALFINLELRTTNENDHNASRLDRPMQLELT